VKFGRTYQRVGIGLVATLLASCAPSYSPTSQVAPVETVQQPSAKSVELSAYYAAIQSDMRMRGLLLQDDFNANTSVSPRILARNFEEIALFDEYRAAPTGFVHQRTPSQLRRWDKPVRMAIEFGSSVPMDVRQADTQFLTNYAQRLSQVADHPISVTATQPNYLVLIVGEDDKAAVSDRVREFVPNVSPLAIDALENLPRSMLCLVYAFPDAAGELAYGKAVAVIRAEHPTLLRRSCIHEEVAQGLGLANDSPRARPSIFNDDEEFGFLTQQDEMLLKILYDRRLSVGMTADQARPIVQTIASELAG